MAEEKKRSYLTGAAILATTVAITKVIGFFYKIPLYNLLGDEGTTHFQVIYTIYSLLLTISTAGIPVAISRLVAESHALGRTAQKNRYFRMGLLVIVLVGVTGMAIMLLLPQQLADVMGDPEVAGGIRALAPAVLFACVISVYRGYSQGHENMLPTAISQIVEVLCKTIFGLSIAWYLARCGFGSATVATGAILGVTIGLGIAVPILMVYKRKTDRGERLPEATDTPLSRGGTVWNILRICIPITLGSSVVNFITLIDTKLILYRLQNGAGFDYEMAKVLYGVYSKAQTLFNFPSAFIVPVTVSVVPAISAALARRNGREAKLVMESSMKLTNLFALPAGIGISVMAQPIFDVLYPNSNTNGPAVLMILGIASYFVCTYLMTTAILQASGFEKMALIALPLGGVVKVLVNWFSVGNPSIHILGGSIGNLTCFAFITVVSSAFILWKVEEPPNFIKILIKPLFCSGIMGAAAWALNGLFARYSPFAFAGARISACLNMVVTIGVAVVVYVLLVLSTRTITKEDMRFVPKGEKLAKLLRMK